MLVPCGHTLAHVCPSCAERARTLRAAQCREGWHLEDEPDLTPDPATEDQQWWVTMRAEAQQSRDQADAAGQDTADFDELIRELDEEITKSGVRGNVAPGPARPAAPVDPPPPGRPRPAPPEGQPAHPRQDLHRAGRQDVPPVHVHHADLPVLRPGRPPRRAGRPGPVRLRPGGPGRADLRRAVRPVHPEPAPLPRPRRAVLRRRRTPAAARSRTSTSPCGAPSPGPSCAGSSPPPTTRSGGPTSRSSTATVTSCPSGTTRWAGTSTRPPARCCRPGMRPWMPSAPYDLPWHVARFGDRFDAQGVLAGSPQTRPGASAT